MLAKSLPRRGRSCPARDADAYRGFLGEALYYVDPKSDWTDWTNTVSDSATSDDDEDVTRRPRASSRQTIAKDSFRLKAAFHYKETERHTRAETGRAVVRAIRPNHIAARQKKYLFHSRGRPNERRKSENDIYYIYI